MSNKNKFYETAIISSIPGEINDIIINNMILLFLKDIYDA